MPTDNSKVFLWMGIIALFLVGLVTTRTCNAVREAKDHKARMAMFGKLQFKGKVIGSRTYRYFNKNYYVVCVKLDSSSINSLYIFNNLDGIRISKGMATFAAGYLNPVLGVVDSVSVNMDKSGKVELYYKAHAREERPLGFDLMGIKESDLKACN
ncbi:MAG: hypothetical protein ACXVIY_11410 [Mucilaginibacter sp.]